MKKVVAPPGIFAARTARSIEPPVAAPAIQIQRTAIEKRSRRTDSPLREWRTMPRTISDPTQTALTTARSIPRFILR
jgi:hypothetical protein